jgi:hypothetical protein
MARFATRVPLDISTVGTYMNFVCIGRCQNPSCMFKHYALARELKEAYTAY